MPALGRWYSMEYIIHEQCQAFSTLVLGNAGVYLEKFPRGGKSKSEEIWGWGGGGGGGGHKVPGMY